MIVLRILISICLFVFFAPAVHTQDTGFVYQDTTIVAVDSVQITSEISDEEYSEDEDEDAIVYVDTSLLDNGHRGFPDSISMLKKQSAFGYAKNLDSLLAEYQAQQKRKKAEVKDEPSWLARLLFSNATIYFFWLLAATFIIFILYKLFFAEGFFQRTYKRSNVTVIHEEPGTLSHSTDYTRLISQALGLKDYRLAIRYNYLHSLQLLALKRVIEVAPDKTNYEYVQELSGKKYKNEFASLTLKYEYAWYGEFDITEQIFNAIQQEFQKFNSGL